MKAHFVQINSIHRYYDDHSEVDEDGDTQLPPINPGDRLKCIYRCHMEEVLPNRGIVELPQVRSYKNFYYC